MGGIILDFRGVVGEAGGEVAEEVGGREVLLSASLPLAIREGR